MTRLKRKTVIMSILFFLICMVLISGGQKASGVTVNRNDDTTPEVLYGSAGYPISLITIDTETGTGNLVGPFGTENCVWGLEYVPKSDILYGVTNDIVDVWYDSQLLKIDRTTGAATPIGGLVGTRVEGLAYDPMNDKLYGCDAPGDNLVVINTSTGRGTVIGPIGFPALEGLAFNLHDGKLYSVDVFSGGPKLVMIDPSTGIGTAVAPIDTSWAQIRGLSFDRSGTLYGAWEAGNGTAYLVTINTSTGQISNVGPIGFGVEGLAFVWKPTQYYDQPIYAWENLTLNRNMTFSYVGLVVMADGITVDGGGNWLEGPSISNSFGIYLLNKTNVTIRNVGIRGFDYGICLDNSTYNTVYGARVTNNTCGIGALNGASYNLITKNTARRNARTGILLFYSSYNNVTENNATENGQYGIELQNSSYNSMNGNNVTANAWSGFATYLSNYNTVFRNTVARNYDGFRIYNSSYIDITENDVTQNDRYGIYLRDSAKNNSINENNVVNNGYGIVFRESSNNTVYHNNLVNNTRQVYDLSWDSGNYVPSINVWDIGYPSGGNYWSDYPPTELYYDDGYAETQFGLAYVAVRFTPPKTGAITNCRFYIWDTLYNPSSWDDEIVKVHVLDANMKDVIEPLYVSINRPYETWYDVDLTQYGITVSAGVDFYIGIVSRVSDTQRVRLFADTSSPDGRSWYYLNGIWTQWNIGDYMIRATIGAGVDNNGDGIGDTPYVIDVNNQDRFPLMVPWKTTVHGVAISNITMYKTVVGQGSSTSINVTVVNQGTYTETFDVTIYANTTSVASQTITVLESLGSTTIIFTWNTTGFVYGNYTITGVAEPVTGETFMADNNYTCCIPVHVGVPGDVSGVISGVCDRIVNMRDVSYLVIRFNARPFSNNWNPNADINNDATVNMRDISIAILNFNRQE